MALLVLPEIMKHKLEEALSGEVSLPKGSEPYFISALRLKFEKPILLITKDEIRRREEIKSLTGDDPLIFPKPDTSPFPDLNAMGERWKALLELAFGKAKTLIASPLAIMFKTPEPKDIREKSIFIRKGDKLPLTKLVDALLSLGYEKEEVVEIPGTFSLRGGIIDVFPPSSDMPLRIEFFGDEVYTMRKFEPSSQKSVENVEDALLSPSSLPENSSLPSFLDENWLLIIEDIEDEIPKIEEKHRNENIIPWEEVKNSIKNLKTVKIKNWLAEAIKSPKRILPQSLPEINKGRRLIIITSFPERVREISHGSFARDVMELPPKGRAVITEGKVGEGIEVGDVLLLTDFEIFGRKEKFEERKVFRRHIPKTIDFSPGDFVVHSDYGIARFLGMEEMDVGGVRGEYLCLEFEGGDKLYVPVEQAYKLSKYISPSGRKPSLTLLRSKEWERTKSRVKKSCEDFARELLETWAKRKVLPGIAFSPDNEWQIELEASFPYEETPDQIKAINEIKRDMEDKKPMERLLCGDVGYGKTEVALRAAFKAVMDGYQVAILVPTTILAEQHLRTFRERLSPFPVRVEALSRLTKNQDEIVKGIKDGTVDICIGTHRLLQKDISFKKLGLLIIDDEHKFGVRHKEKLKRMKENIDVLSITATPIPRTLYMALSGIIDISLIETPPEERIPVRTYVGEYDEELVREAVLKEMERDGRVFFVHNRIKNIWDVYKELKDIVPEARIVVAHGRMKPYEIEEAVVSFIRGEADVLLSTNIIEAGLDIPLANTLIVRDADKFGLVQLYQLRGRIGRGDRLAYSYFLYRKGKKLTDKAKERLRTIYEAAELGAGFYIALKDLEIRGAGNILGPEQSGNMGSVGFYLYTKLLEEAVEKVKAEFEGRPLKPRPQPPRIDLPIEAYIPREYIREEMLRLSIYKRLAEAMTLEDVSELEKEMEDRFGKPPNPLKNLFKILRIRVLGTKLGVKRIYKEGRDVVLFWGRKPPVSRGRVLSNQVRIKMAGDWLGEIEEVLKGGII